MLICVAGLIYFQYNTATPDNCSLCSNNDKYFQFGAQVSGAAIIDMAISTPGRYQLMARNTNNLASQFHPGALHRLATGPLSTAPLSTAGDIVEAGIDVRGYELPAEQMMTPPSPTT